MIKKDRFVYVAYHTNVNDAYVGSSACDTLLTLETNHRQWRSKGYKETHFRKYLDEHGDDVKFDLLDTIENCDQALIEIIEEEWISTLRATLNVDHSPTKSSLKYKRYTQADLDRAIVVYNSMNRTRTLR